MANHVLVRDGGHVASNCGGRGREQAGSEKGGNCVICNTWQYLVAPSNTPQYPQLICSTGQGRADVGSTPAMLCNVVIVQYRTPAMVFLLLVLVLEVVHIVLVVHSGADLQWFLH